MVQIGMRVCPVGNGGAPKGPGSEFRDPRAVGSNCVVHAFRESKAVCVCSEEEPGEVQCWEELSWNGLRHRDYGRSH